MVQRYSKEYYELVAQYEKSFKEDFIGLGLDAEESMAIIRECLKTGKPYDPTTNPNFHPGADY